MPRFNRSTHKVINTATESVFEGTYQQCLRYMVDLNDDTLTVSPINSLLDEVFVLNEDSYDEYPINLDED